MSVQTPHEGELALADLLDRALNKGVVLWGDATISLAGVDLVYIGLRVLVASCSTMEAYRFGRADETRITSGGG